MGLELSTFITGELNLDQAAKYMPKGDYPYARNMIPGTSVSSDNIRLEKIIGTTAISESLGYTVNKVIGSCKDEASGDVYILATSSVSTANKIIKKDSDDVLSTVISYDFGWTDSLILNSVFFIQDSIVWIDNSNEIKRLQLDAYPVTPTAGALDDAEITIMKKPPLTQPYCMMWTDDDLDVKDRDYDYQFATYFEYIDGGKSVLSPYSKQLPRVVDGYNRFFIYPDIPAIDVVGVVGMPSGLRRNDIQDTFPKNAKSIVVCARNIRSTTWYEVGKINREKDSTKSNGFDDYEKAYIEFKAPLSGIAVPSTQTGTQYFVPKDPGAIQVANNKLFTFNFNEGYEAPIADLALSTVAKYGSTTTFSGGVIDIVKMDYYQIDWDAANSEYVRTRQTEATYTKYAYLDNDGWRDTDFNPATYVHGTTIINAIAGVLDLSGTGVQGVNDPYYRFYSDPNGKIEGVLLHVTDVNTLFDPVIADGTYGDMQEAGLPFDGIGGMVFPVNGRYSLGLVFSDGFGRKSDVVTKSEWTIGFTKEKFLYMSSLRYDLQLEPVDIPSWATSAEVLITGNVETATFIEGESTGIGFPYVNTDGDVVISPDYTADKSLMGISIEGIIRQGFGYSFEKGDMVRLYDLKDKDLTTTVTIDVPIVSQEGNWIYVNAVDYTGQGDVWPAGTTPLIIYRKRDTEADTILYGNGISHLITQGARNNFQGSISGDSAMNEYGGFITVHNGTYDTITVASGGPDQRKKVTSLDDDGVWVYGRGKAFIETNFGTVIKENYARWGANIINDTKINGLGDFLALDEKSTPVEHGAINAVALVGDTQSAGTVILALTATKPISLYIGATTLTNSDGTNAAIKSTDEIGLVRPQESDYGTTNPESVFSRDGNVFYYDSINRCYCRYAANGVTEISKKKVSTFFRDVPLATSKVITGYYNEYNMLMITVKDGYGAITETIGYDVEENKWKGFFDIFPDAYFNANDVMYTFKSGTFYKSLKEPSSDGLRSYFHGAQFDSIIDVVFNADVDAEKIWDLIQIHINNGSIEWNSGIQRLIDTLATITVSNEKGQSSESGIADMVIENDIITSSILLDANSTGGYLSGDEVMSKEVVARLKFTTSDNIQLGIIKAIYTPTS